MTEPYDPADAYARGERRTAAVTTAARWQPCTTCDGTGRDPTVEWSFDTMFSAESDCPTCTGTGAARLPPTDDAYPVRFGGHAGWLTLAHPDFADQAVIVDAATGEVYQSAHFSGELLVLNANGLADLTDFQAADDLLHRARREGFRVRLAEYLWPR